MRLGVVTIIVASVVMLWQKEAQADQCVGVSPGIAARAKRMLTKGVVFVSHCEPCAARDRGPSIPQIVRTSRVKRGSYSSVLVNGRAYDLAYLFVKRGGQYVNVALASGCKASNVSARLTGYRFIRPEYRDAHLNSNWLGRWNIVGTAVYSTCGKVKVGYMHVASLALSMRNQKLIAHEVTRGKRRTYHATVASRAAMSFRSGSQYGLDLWLDARGKLKVRRVSTTDPFGRNNSCVSIWDLKGTRR